MSSGSINDNNNDPYLFEEDYGIEDSRDTTEQEQQQEQQHRHLRFELPSEEVNDPNDYNNDNNNNENQQQEQDQMELSAPRNHSYLPGTLHPLLSPSEAATSSGNTKRKHNAAAAAGGGGVVNSSGINIPSIDNEKPRWQQQLFPLAILELHGLVLFPESTIPIRLRKPCWIQYLGKLIDAQRNCLTPQTTNGSNDYGQSNVVQLGIITTGASASTTSFSSSSFTTTTTTSNRPIRRSSPHSINSNTQQSRRSSWMRSAMTAQEGRRLSMVLQDEFSAEFDDNSNNNNDSANSHHPYKNRIGTIATITATLGDSIYDSQNNNGNNDNDNMDAIIVDGSQTSIWQSHDFSSSSGISELVVTAIGTRRFRIHEEYQNTDFSTSNVPIFLVEELPEESFLCPPLFIPKQIVQSSPRKDEEEEEQQQQQSHQYNKHLVQLQNLSMITPIPAVIVYKKFWPWKLVSDIESMLRQAQTHQNLPSMDNYFMTKNQTPTKVSYYLSFHLPFTIEEKLELLQMNSTVERLQRIHKQVLEYMKSDCYICCKVCETKFTSIDKVFTVGGADGASGNYVNEHGYIHQITTIREVATGKVIHTSDPQTANSYFPSYSWDITYCRRCSSLLGWKFAQCGQQTQTKNRPLTFYGFMGSAIVTLSK